MQNPDNRPLAPNQEKIVKAVDEMDSNNKEKKTRLLLAHEIQNREKENVFLTHKAAKFQKELDNTVSAIESLNSRLIKPKEELSLLVKEKKKSNLKIDELKKFETEYKEKKSLLPGLNRNISEVDNEVSKLMRTCKTIEQKWNQVNDEKKALEVSKAAIADKLSGLETTLPALQNTRSLLHGILPEGYDVKTFDEVSVDFEKLIETYYDEINNEIAQVKEQTRDLENQVDKENQIEKSIGPEKAAMVKEAETLLDAEHLSLDAATVSAELAKLCNRNQELDTKKDKLTAEVKKRTDEIADLDEGIAAQKSHTKNLKDRYAYLVELTNTVAKMDSIDDEIKKVQAKSRKIEIEQKLCNELIGTIKNIQADLGLTNEKLRFIYSDYNDKLEYFDQSINQLFSQ